jgi:protein archease
MDQERRSPAGRASGHREVPHTADLRIEAWAATREECVAEAVRALVGSFAETDAALPAVPAERHITGNSDADLVVAALDEVIYTMDTDGKLPVGVEARRSADEGIDLTLWLMDLGSAEITGAVPKAATLSGVRCSQEPSGRWLCAVTVDV